MRINPLSACFSGHRERKLPYNIQSKEYAKLKSTLKREVEDLIRNGVSEWYCGCQNGCDELASMTVIELKDEIGATANLNLVLPYVGMDKDFNIRQRKTFQYIKKRACSFTVLYDKHTAECFRYRNQHMVNRSNFMIAICIKTDARSGTQMTINMAIKKGIEVRIIDPITYEIEVISAKEPIQLFID